MAAPVSTNPPLARALSREAIRKAPAIELATEAVEIPEWSGHVIIRQFTGADTDAIADLIEKRDNRGRKITRAGLRPYILIRAVVDDAGQRVFSNADIDYLAGLPVRVTNRMIEALQRLNGGDNLEEEFAANFEEGPDEDSPSS